MDAGLHHQPGGAHHGLGGIGQGLVPGQAAGHPAVGQALQEQGAEGRSAAGQSAGRVNEPFPHGVHQSGGSQQSLKCRQLPLRNPQAAHLDHPAAHGGGGVGHQPDDRAVQAGQLLNAPGFQSGGQGGQHEAVLPGGQGGGDALKHFLHHLGLYAQKDQRAGLGNLLIGDRGSAQLLRQSPGLGRGPVGEKQPGIRAALGRGPGQNGPHSAGADKTDGMIHSEATS